MTPQGYNEGRVRRRYTTRDAAVDAQIETLLSGVGDEFDRRLLAELVTSVYRLGQEGASTGDLKVLNAAVKELRYAFKIFRPYRRIRKVATFGSARVPQTHASYSMAKRFGELMAKARWMMITGAASGIMKAGHEGAGRKASFGLNIRLPLEQAANPIIAHDRKLISCKYFFTRKLLFMKESHATALFPGGFGTLDEGFEAMTLVQTGKADPRPIVLVETARGHFWRPLLRFVNETLARSGMISRYDRSLICVVRSEEDAVKKILGFYRVYHSMRYVGERVVLRLERGLPERAVAHLSRDFRDILSSGTMVQGKALPAESDEPDISHLPRLSFLFNRREYGRLAELIHAINDLDISDESATSGKRGNIRGRSKRA